MTSVGGQSLAGLEEASGRFAALIERELRVTMRATLMSLGTVTAAAVDNLSADDLNTFLASWAQVVDDVLMGAVEAEYLAASLAEIDQILEALSTVLAAPQLQQIRASLSGQAISEGLLSTARNRLVGVGEEVWLAARDELTLALQAGEGIPAMVDRITSTVDSLGETRATRIARTETISVRNAASLDVVDQLEVAASKRWQATGDDRTRPSHLEADGQQVPINEPFEVGGSALMHPGDPNGPPDLIINCRCTMTFEFDEDELLSLLEDDGALVAAANGHIPKGYRDQLVAAYSGTVIDGGDTLTAAADQEDIMADDTDGIMQGVAIVEGEPTGDGRQFDSVSWPDPAQVIIPFEWQKETTHGGTHDVVVPVGRVISFERVGNEIRFEAKIDLGSADGAEAWRRYSEGFIGGVSIVADDPDDPFSKDVQLVWPEQCELTDDMSEEQMFETMFSADCASPDLAIFPTARIRSLTLVNTAAFIEATADVQPLAASGATHVVEIPDRPPLAWFQEPSEAPEIGLIQVTDAGRVYGYVAPKGVAHRAIADRDVQVPLGNVDYRSWMNRPTILDTGERIATGVVTMDCGHASTMAWVGAKQSIDHYDNACSVIASARIGENAYGVWIAGALMPGVTGTQVARMMACQLSGDWRPHRAKVGWREFTAALVVPVPALTAPSMRIQGGALVASAVPIKMSWSNPLVASVVGEVDLPVAPRDTEWDGQAAQTRVFDLCTDGDTVDAECVSRAFLWRDNDADPTTREAYSLGFADVVEGRLQIVPAGVAATAGGRGVDATDIASEDKDRIKSRICSLYDQIQDQIDDWPDCPFERESETSAAATRAFSVYAKTIMSGAGLDETSRAARAMEGVMS